MGTAGLPWTNLGNKQPSYVDRSNRRQHQCIQVQAMETEETTATLLQQHSPKMASFISSHTTYQLSYNLPIFVCFLLVASSSLTRPVLSVSSGGGHLPTNQTLRPLDELVKLKRIQAHLKKINKPAVKTIQSPDGDTIDCVKTHLQPAFDHPQLKGKKPLHAPERPKGLKSTKTVTLSHLQLWTSSNETCPEGTIPVRRTTEKDVLRSSTLRRRFGRKISRVRKDSVDGHEHAVAFVKDKGYFGAKASMNVWVPKVANQYEFSLSQLWVISGTFGQDLNTIEAGWQVSPELYGDSSPRFFTYWTSDAYQTTGCYNLLCSGFIQINNRFAIGAAISPRSMYLHGQFDIELLVWKDPKHGHWWLEYGCVLIGYWPAYLFSHLKNSADMIQFGGEIVNSRAGGVHTATQMGSGHFPGEGYGKASYFRNLQVVDSDNSLVPPYNLRLFADHPSCYDIKKGYNNVWGVYFYYGGPGRNVRCP